MTVAAAANARREVAPHRLADLMTGVSDLHLRRMTAG